MSAIYVGKHNGKKVLFLVNDASASPEQIKEYENAAALYQGDKLLGVNLFDEALTADLPLGLLVHPNEEISAKLNQILEKNGLPKYQYVESGYEVMEVKLIEEHPLNEKLSILTLAGKNGECSSVTRYCNYKVGDHVVVAKDGTFLFDGSVFHKRVEKNIPIDVTLCSERDLCLGENYKEAFLANDKAVGEDFFA